MELISSAAALLSVSLSLARLGSQLHAAVACGDVAERISRRNKLLSAACAMASLSCSSLSGIDIWMTCSSLLNVSAALVSLRPRWISFRFRATQRAANGQRSRNE